jgi:RNA polymerase sigma factor (sigma-70 family)
VQEARLFPSARLFLDLSAPGEAVILKVSSEPGSRAMSQPNLDSVFRHLRHYLSAERAAGVADGELLRRFATAHDESAFTVLLQRYGPLVLGVCRRVLAREQDAEDAFQATFLILVRRAGALDRRGSLANWLYTVAHHVALKARAGAARRRAAAVPLDDLPAPDAGDDLDRRELRAVLDEELRGLPAKYREPLLLCDLQGRPHAEAARALGRPPGSMSRLLERGRSLLRDRLTRRGVALSAGLLAAALAENARAVTPAALAQCTLRAAATGPIPSPVLVLVEGVLRQMFVTKLKIAAALLLTVGLLGTGAGLLTAQSPPQEKPEAPPAARAAEPDRAETADLPADLPLPAGALARLGTARFRHAFNVRSLAFSPDGKVIASGSQKNTIRLWDADTGQELKVLTGHGNGVVGLCFSPDGKTLASSSWDTSIRLWDVAGGNEVRRIDPQAGVVNSVAFSPDGKALLSAHGDGTARLGDAATGTELRQFQGHQGAVEVAAFSRDGKMIATGSQDNSARLWDAATGKELRKLEGHTARVRGVAFSPDGKRLLTAGWNPTARLYDVETGKQVAELKHTTGPEGVAFSPDGKTVALATGWGDTAAVWDVTGDVARLRWTGKVGQPIAVTFSPDGQRLAAAGWDSAVHVWDVATGKELAASRPVGHTTWVHTVALLPDRKTLVSASADGQVIVWDAASGKPLRQGHVPGTRAWCLAVSPDGKALAVGCHDQTVQLWDIGTLKPTGTFKADGSVHGLAFSPDGRHLAVVCGDEPDLRSAREVKGDGAGVWDVATGQRLLRLDGHEGAVKTVAYSPDGKTIATGGADRTARLWDAATGKELRSFTEHGNVVEKVLFSPDGTRFATAARGGTARVWRLASDDPPLAINTGQNAHLWAAAFSADGRLLATGTRGPGPVKAAVRVWDVATGKERARFVGHQETAAGLDFSADGRVLTSGGGDGAVLLWDLTGRVEKGKFVTAELTPPALESEWGDLLGDDAMKAHRAGWALAAAPKQALPLLREVLKPVKPADEKRIAQLIKDLDADDFDAREKASAELEKIGEPAAPALRKALEGTPTAELRIRATQLLDKFGGKVVSADALRRERALEVLEHVGGAEARALLEEIAKGAPEAALTQQAKAALTRLGK